jgi:hypothetical protein
MKKLLATIGLGCAVLACGSAMADDRWGDRHSGEWPYSNGLYVGVSAGALIYREDGIDTLQPSIGEIRLGQEFNPYLAIEGRIGTGIGADEANGFRTSVQAVYAGYVKGILPLTPWLSGYGLAGVAGVQLHRNYADYNSNDAGLSVGIGAELKLRRGTSLTLEWVRLTTGTNDRYFDYTADQVALGVNWRW